MKNFLILILISSVSFGQSILISPQSAGAGVVNSNSETVFTNRLRLNHSGSTSGLWMNNSANSLNIGEGAFWGMKNNTESGLWIGGNWRYWINNLGVIHSTSLAGTGSRLVYANSNGGLTTGAAQRIHSVSGLNFKVYAPANPTQVLKTMGIDVFGNEGDNYSLISHIELENGARVTKIEVDFLKEVVLPTFKFTFSKLLKSNIVFTEIASLVVSPETVANSYFLTGSIVTNEVIDNSQYYYFLHISPWQSGNESNWTVPNHFRIRGYRVFNEL